MIEPELTIPKATYTILFLQGNYGPIPTLKKTRKAKSKGSSGRRIIKVVSIGGYEFSYHATRGWRKNKA